MAVCIDTFPVSSFLDLASTTKDLTSLTLPSSTELASTHNNKELLFSRVSTKNNDALTDRIVELIARFLYLKSPNDQFQAVGRAALRQTVYRYVEKNEKMELVFPGFPFKSPSDKKVLGRLPDLGEELLLRRLEDLARTIEEYHCAGAVVRIVSDGIVYGEILGQNDRSVYQYNETLRKMTLDYGLTHITFVRVVDLLDPTCGLEEKIMSEDEYAQSIPEVRVRFLAHQVPGFDLERSMKEEPGTLRTYRGYLKFLERDLAGSMVMNGSNGKPLSKNGQDRARRVIAKQMLHNGAKFSDLAALKFPDCVRLSVHPHSNAGPKFAFEMFPGLDMAASPWHNVVMEKADGGLIMGHFSSFDPSTYDIVSRNGYPYYLREISEDRDLGSGISLTPAFPHGLIVQADANKNGTRFKFEDVSMDKIRSLASKYSLLVLKGFEVSKQDELREKLRELSVPESDTTPVLHPLERRNGPSAAAGNLQFIHCVRSSPESIIKLTNTALLIQRALTFDQVEMLSKRHWITSSPDEESREAAVIFVNPSTNRQVLRYPVTGLSATKALITGLRVEESDCVHATMLDLLNDRRVCYTHQFERDDLIIYDSKEIVGSQAQASYQDEELVQATIY